MNSLKRWVGALHSSQLRLNTTAGVASGLITGLTASVSYPTYLHFLGYEQYGLWLTISLLLALTQFGNFGITPAIIKLVAKEHGQQNIEGIERYVSTALVIVGIGGCAVLGGAFAFRHALIAFLHLTGAQSAVAAHLAVFVGLLSLYALQIDALNAVLIGLGRLDLAVATQCGMGLLTLGVSVCCFACGMGVVGLAVANLTGYVVLHMVTLLLIRKSIGTWGFRLRAFDCRLIPELLTVGGTMVSCSVMNLMLAPLSKMMLARHLGTASVPTFEIAYNIAFRLRGLLESGFRAIMPEVSRLSATDTPEANTRIRSVQRRAEWLVFTAALPMFASVVVFCTPILHLWLRHRYRADIPTAVQILAVGAFLSLLGVPAYHVLLGAGQLKQVLTAHALQASTNGLLLAALMFLGRRTLSTDLVAFTTTCGFAVGGLYTFIASRRYAPKRHPLTTAALQKIGGAETPAEVATEAKAPGQMVTMKLHCEPLPSE